MGIIAFKGATAYEFQIGRLVIKLVHLSSPFPWWRRLSIWIAPKEDQCAEFERGLR